MAQSKGLNNVFKLRDIINVKEPVYGAKGDGTTDDAAAVQAALNAASGKALYFPTGTYLINTTLDIPTNVLILGDGYGSEIKAGANPVAQAISRSNVSMRGLRFTSNGSVSFTITFRLCTNVRVENCIINHLVGAVLGTQAMRFQGTIGASVVNSQFYDSSEAHIYLDSWPVSGAGTHSDLIDVVGCYFENTIVGNYATPAAIYQYYCKKLAVDNCTFKNIRSDGTGANMAYSVYEGDGAADSLSVTNCTTINAAGSNSRPYTMVNNSNAVHCTATGNKFFGLAQGLTTNNWLFDGGASLGSVIITDNYSEQGGIVVRGGGTAATRLRSAIIHDNQIIRLAQTSAGIRLGSGTIVGFASIKNNVVYATYAASILLDNAAYAVVEGNHCMNWNTSNFATHTTYGNTAAIVWQGGSIDGVCRRNRLINDTTVVADTGYPDYGITCDTAVNTIEVADNILSSAMVDGNYVNLTPWSGTYTPTLTNTANLAASTAYTTQYMRVGNSVTVAGAVSIDPTAAAPTATQLGISLPIASNFSGSENAGGTAASANTETETFAIYADATNDRVVMDGLARNTANHAVWFTFTYRVI